MIEPKLAVIVALALSVLFGPLAAEAQQSERLYRIGLLDYSAPDATRRRQGPDTGYARSCYVRHLAQSPPEDITNICCREEWRFGGDSIHTMRFSFRNESALVELIQRLGLESVPPTNRDRVRYLSGPSWWPTRAQLAALLEAYHRSRVEFLCIDRNLGEAYFQRANF